MVIRINKRALRELLTLCEDTGLNYAQISPHNGVKLVENKSSLHGHYFNNFTKEEIEIERVPTTIIELGL